MRAPPSSLTRVVLGLAAAAVLALGLWQEVRLAGATARARGVLPRALGTAAEAAPGETERSVLTQAQRLLEGGLRDQAAQVLAARTERVATAEAHALAATAAAAAGDYDAQARHASFATRLAPGESAPRAEAERSLDLAMLGRLRGPARAIGALGALVVLGLWWRRGRRRRYARRLALWLAGLEISMNCRVDGATISSSRAAAPIPLSPSTKSVALDFFLRPEGPIRRPPRPGPTLAVVLSQAGSNLSLRLTPRHDVREDAVRLRIRDRTLARLLARPGTWRLQARLDERVVGDASFEVVSEPGRRPKHLHLVGRA